MADTPTDQQGDSTGHRAALHYDEFYGPLYFEPYAIEVAKRIDVPDASLALELAAGTGRMTRHIRALLDPSARLIASDISPKMLAIAKGKLADHAIEWQRIDAQMLPFADDSIDLIVCCFGYMFVPDRERAFAEVHRVLRKNGQFIFTTWDTLESNEASFALRSIARQYLKGGVPASYDQATSMSDEKELQHLLLDASFNQPSVEKVTLLSAVISASAAAAGFTGAGSVFDEIRKQDPGLLPEIMGRLESVFADRFGKAPMIVPLSAWICQGRK